MTTQGTMIDKASQRSSSVPVPATQLPDVGIHVKIDRILQIIISEYSLNLNDDDDQKDIETIAWLLNDRSDEVIHALYQSLDNEGLVLNLMLDAVTSKSYSDAKVLETIAFAPAFRVSESMHGILNGLTEYEDIFPVMDDYSKSAGTVREHATTLITFTSALVEELPHLPAQLADYNYLPLQEVNTKDGSLALKISDDELVRYLLNNTEHAEQISQIVIQRKTTDLALIDSIVHSAAPSVSYGIL